MNIFVTGATGFLGKAFVRRLLSKKEGAAKIYLLARSHVDLEIARDPRVQVVTGQPGDLTAFENELLDSDYVFHIGANANFTGRVDYDAENFAPTQKMIERLKSSRRLKNFVFISSIGAVDRAGKDRCRQPLKTDAPYAARSPYGRSKQKCEEYLRASGLPFTIIRPTWIYGAGMRVNSHISQFVTMLAGGSPLARVAFPGRVSLIHVDDLATALVQIPGQERFLGKTIFAATEQRSLGDIMALIQQALRGQRPAQLPVPLAAFFTRYLHPLMPLAAANLFVDYLCADEHEFLQAFGIRQPVLFEQGLKDVLAAHPRVSGAYVITGAGSGIGLALAKELDRRGKKLILVDRNTQALHSFGQHKVLTVDLAQRPQVENLAATLNQERLAGLINNAGVGYRRSTETITLPEIDTTISVNMAAPVVLTKLCLPRLIKDQAAIVNIGSSVAYNPLPNMSLYAASKAFLVSWSEALSYELKNSNYVLTVSPSGTYTGFQKGAGVKVLNEGKGLATPEAVATRIAQTLFKRKKRVLILGAPSKVLITFSKLLPREWNIKFWGLLFGNLR